ncbi:UTP--glucose-1-phosphate uridylyltransferase [Thalassoroseus pseudoceratinae]|uniref:UTP--glucose-1-phosphate uridylyltransferase n=1 Tax=Thalassoroseus pseudoceratinae TaxID=2713176 RepID=UPI001422E663|nr:UDPGP type 1 family protein [Thalassoroseus pseudoceratinae]
MSHDVPNALQSRLAEHDQSHVLRWWDELDSDQKSQLTSQLDGIDFAVLNRCLSAKSTDESDTPAAKAQRATPPTEIVRLPQTPAELKAYQAAEETGQEMLRAGRVGVVLVAGGQGTRLGFPHPKGMFPVGPVSGSTLFQIFAEQVSARSRDAGAIIPFYIMTSEATHAETVDFWESQEFFGLDPSSVRFFQQGTMPAVDAETHRLLLAEPHRLCTSPDGHGGLLAALDKSGCLDDMRQRGVDRLFYHQVDNPTVKVCDPAFLGFHELRNSELSSKVVPKRSAEEKMGVVVAVDGVTQIIEYSDLPPDVAARTTSDGELELWCGSIAVHVFSRDFLERLIGSDAALPFHLAHKKVLHIDGNARLVQPNSPNAIKFERFIFDALPHAKTALVMEADRAREFNPVKNAEGQDSPATARAAITRIAREWLQAADQPVPESAEIEIGPLFALDAEQVQKRFDSENQFASRTFFG